MRTDLLAQKIVEELERNRPWLDRMNDLRSVSIDIKFVKETGLPRIVIVRTESER